MDKQQIKSLRNIIDYLYVDEKNNYDEMLERVAGNAEKMKDHIFKDIHIINEFLATYKEEKPPINWTKRADEDAETLCDDMEDDIKKAVASFIAGNDAETLKEIKNNAKYYSIDDEVANIYDDLYQDEDIANRAWEYADGNFIYNSTSHLIEAMNCLEDLSDYGSGDSGLWEGKTEYWDIINIQAMDAYQGRTMYTAQEKIKDEIHAVLVEALKALKK